MDIVLKILDIFWKNVKKSDEKRLSKRAVPDGVTEICNIPYCDSTHKLNLLDVYYPEGTKETDKLPVVIDVHGGGWFYGDKELNKNFCLAIAQRGFVVFNISYRLCPEVSMARRLGDVMKALLWIKNNLSSYPCDETKTMIVGDSAGGRLAFYAGACCKSEKIRNAFETVNPEFVPNCLGLVSPVAYLYPEKGIMGLNAKKVLGKDFSKKPWSKYLGATEILRDTDVPPSFVITSSGDGVGLKPSLKLAREIKDKGICLKLSNWGKYNGRDLPHVFSVLYPLEEHGKKAISEMLEFFESNY